MTPLAQCARMRSARTNRKTRLLFESVKYNCDATEIRVTGELKSALLCASDSMCVEMSTKRSNAMVDTGVQSCCSS